MDAMVRQISVVPPSAMPFRGGCWATTGGGMDSLRNTIHGTCLRSRLSGQAAVTHGLPRAHGNGRSESRDDRAALRACLESARLPFASASFCTGDIHAGDRTEELVQHAGQESPGCLRGLRLETRRDP